MSRVGEVFIQFAFNTTISYHSKLYKPRSAELYNIHSNLAKMLFLYTLSKLKY